MSLTTAEEGSSGIEQSLFQSPVSAGDFSLAHADDLILHPNPTEQADASAYLSSDFGLYLNPNAISAFTVQEIGQLQADMGELAHASRQVEFTGRYTEALPQTTKIKQAKEEAVGHMKEVIARISELKIVHGGELQSQFDGAVKKDLSPEDKYLSTVFFLLSYKKADVLTTRAIVDQTIERVSEIKPSRVIWNELAEKYDTFTHRLSPPESERTFRQLPPALRLLAYGHRLGLSSKPDEYYLDIADQSDDVARFDTLVNDLRRKITQRASYGEVREVFFDILKLSFLHGETGAFRERDDFLKNYDSGLHHGLLFILLCVENIGIDGAGEMNKWIHSLGLVSRSVMGRLPAEMKTVPSLLVSDEEKQKRFEEYEELAQAFRRTAHSMGSSTS